MNDNVKYQLGDLVYSVIAGDLLGQITGILFRPTGVYYFVTWQDDLE